MLSATFLFSKFYIASINISFKIDGKTIPDRCVTSHDIDKNIHFGLSSWQKNAVVNRKEIDLAMPQENLKRRK